MPLALLALASITALKSQTILQENLLLEVEILCLGSLPLVLPVYLDTSAYIFLITVCTISGAVMVFSISYISAEKYFLRFHLLVLSFIVSIIVLIISPHLIAILIGWDGLGITSYLLVIYFQSRKSYGAGIITAITNRLGDVLLLLSISFTTNNRS